MKIKKLKQLAASFVVATTMMVGIFAIAPATVSAVPCTDSNGVTTEVADAAACTAAGGSVSSGNKTAICEGVGLVDGQTSCSTGNPQKAVGDVVGAAIDLISIVVGVIAVIMIIIGGLKYIMSSGDSNNIQSAKNTILYAIIGLVVVALAQIIVRYVLTNV